MCHAGNLKSTRCSISALAILIIVALALMTMGIIACGPGLIGARAAVERAEEQGRKLQSMNTPESVTLAFRIHMTAARKALEKHHYTASSKEAQAAEMEARRIAEQRQAQTDEIRKKLDEILLFIETQPRPPKATLDGYFDILDMLENQEIEKAANALTELQTTILREGRFMQEPGVIVQAEPWYYQERKFIPLYGSVSDNGNPGNIIFEIKEPVHAKFLGSRFFSREWSYTHVYIEGDKYNIEGWVDRRFID